MERVFTFEGHSDTTLTAILFKGVQNAGELQKQIVEGAIPVDCAFVNAALVPDLFLLQLAANATLVSQRSGKLTTRSVHAELLYNLSGSRHISESLKRFGVHEGVSAVLVARFNANAEEVGKIKEFVRGQAARLDELATLTDEATLQKFHKVTPLELKVGSLADAIACRMAVRDC